MVDSQSSCHIFSDYLKLPVIYSTSIRQKVTNDFLNFPVYKISVTLIFLFYKKR